MVGKNPLIKLAISWGDGGIGGVAFLNCHDKEFLIGSYHDLDSRKVKTCDLFFGNNQPQMYQNCRDLFWRIIMLHILIWFHIESSTFFGSDLLGFFQFSPEGRHPLRTNCGTGPRDFVAHLLVRDPQTRLTTKRNWKEGWGFHPTMVGIKVIPSYITIKPPFGEDFPGYSSYFSNGLKPPPSYTLVN